MGSISILAILVNFYIGFLWIANLSGCFLTKQINKSIESDANDSQNESEPQLSHASFSRSTKVYISLIVSAGFVMHLTEALRISYLTLHGNDVRVTFGEWFCRIHVFLKMFSLDISTWCFALLCFENLFPVVIFERCLTSSSFTSEIFITIQVLIVTAISLTASITPLIPSNRVCSQFYHSVNLIYSRFILTTLLPSIISIVSSTLIIRKIYRREMVMMLNTSQHSTSLSDENSSTGITVSPVVKVFAAKMKILIACSFLLFQLLIYVFLWKRSNYCCFILIQKQLNNEDYYLLALLLMQCILNTVESYLLLITSPNITCSCVIINIIIRRLFRRGN
ncbi:unnamed protein product [Trichobilharzia regenti]|nr:unnamed protein product [Trichobilharzia regenti]